MTPLRTPGSIYVDPTNANHALVSFNGYGSNTPTTPGHVFDVVFDPAAGTATWTDISYDLLDQPVNDVLLDVATGDVYASTDSAWIGSRAGARPGCPRPTVCPRPLPRASRW